MFKNWNSKFKTGFSLAVVLALVFTIVALADDISNNLDHTIDATLETMPLTTGGPNGSVGLYVEPTGEGKTPVDGKSGCNLTGQTTLVVSVNSSNSSVATVSPTQITFDSCGNTPSITVTPVAAGSATISLSQVSNNTDGSFNLAPASFTVNVSAPPPSDSTPPVITPNVSGTLGNNGWYVSDVTVSWTVTDPESSITSSSGCDSTTINTDTAGVTLTCSATSAGGTSSQSVTIKRDATAPSVSASASPAANANGWNNTDVTVSYTCTDNGPSGVDSAASDLGNDVLTASGTASGTCVDNAGNSASASYSAQIDKAAPSITATPNPPANSNGWNNTDVTVSYTCDDGSGSGVDAAISDMGDDTLSASSTASGTCVDKAGNSASASYTAQIDKEAPTITANANPGPNANGWNNTDVTVSYICTDNGPSGVDAAASSLGDDVLSASGTASGTCVDMAGNSTSASYTAQIDKEAPTILASISPAADSSTGWYNISTGAPTVSFTCNDTGGSGLAGPCPAAVILGEGAGQSVSGGPVSDLAGNTSGVATISNIDVDLTAPGIAWTGGPADDSSHYFGFVPAEPTCTAADDLSGPDGCSVTGYSTSVGPHTLTATAKDMAGNQKVETRSYTVLAWTLNGFFKPVDMPNPALVLNIVKNGSTVPLKFEIFAGSTELTDVVYVRYLKYALIQCNATAPEEPIETTATGGTSLRYDTTGGQFIFNWKTPSPAAGKCYQVTMTTWDGSENGPTLVAYFKLK